MSLAHNGFRSSILGSPGEPYQNSMNIQIAFKLDGGAFNEIICDAVMSGLTALAVLVAPKLVGPDIAEDLESEAICHDVAEGIDPRSLQNMTSPIPRMIT